MVNIHYPYDKIEYAYAAMNLLNLRNLLLKPYNY